MTAAELMAKLENDPKYQAMRRKKDAEHAARVAINLKDQEELAQELRDAGVIVELTAIPGKEYVGPPRTISDLVNSKREYPEAIPILVRHLRKKHNRNILQAIVRALTTPEAEGVAFGSLVKLFEETMDGESQLKWLIGGAIAETATEADIEKVVALANDKRHGFGRALLPFALRKWPPERAMPVLLQWESDPVLGEEAKKTLKRLRRKR